MNKLLLLLLPITLLLGGCSMNIKVQCIYPNTTGYIDTGIDAGIDAPDVFPAINIYNDGWAETGMVLFCATKMSDNDTYNYYVEGFYLDRAGQQPTKISFPSSRIDEEQGGYGCLEASVRVGYCTYIEDIRNDTGNKLRNDIIGMGADNIAGDIVSKDRDNFYGNNGTAKSCDDFSEKQKYNQKYRIENVLEEIQYK